jgi:hypothetical protein
MRRLLPWFVLASLCCFAQSPSKSRTAPETFDFGTVKQGTKITHEFAVWNPATAPATIQRVDMSMPGMTARFKPTVAAGGKNSVTLQWDTTHVMGEIEGAATVQFADASRRPVSLLLKGVVKPPLEILPFPAIFLSAFQGEDTRRRLQIINREEQPTTVSLPQQSSKHFVASIRTVEAGKRYALMARVAPGVPPGRYEEELSLSTSNPKIGQVTIPVHLFVKPDLYANPDRVDFGSFSAEKLRSDSRQAQVLSQSFLVKRRKGSFAITRLASDLKGVNIQKDPAQGRSSSYRIDVTLDPQHISPGKMEGFIEIHTDDKEFPEVKVRVAAQVF